MADMTVVSVSLGEDNLKELEYIQSTYGLRGRSDAVRCALDLARAEMQDLESLSGTVEGVLITVRHDHADPWMGVIQAKFVGSIKTQVHTHLADRKCLEVMVLCCSSDELKEIMREIRASGKADYVRFVRSRGIFPVFSCRGFRCCSEYIYFNVFSPILTVPIGLSRF